MALSTEKEKRGWRRKSRPMSPPGKKSGFTTKESVVKAIRDEGTSNTALSFKGFRYSFPKTGRNTSSINSCEKRPPPPWANRISFFSVFIVLSLAVIRPRLLEAIFSGAEANPSLYRVILRAEASARYSLLSLLPAFLPNRIIL